MHYTNLHCLEILFSEFTTILKDLLSAQSPVNVDELSMCAFVHYDLLPPGGATQMKAQHMKPYSMPRNKKHYCILHRHVKKYHNYMPY